MNKRQDEFVSGSKFVVTGGAGFIGSHLVDRLLELGAKSVVIIDDLRTGYLDNLPKDSRIEVILSDFSALSPKKLASGLRGASCLFHLAAIKHQGADNNPDDVLKVNGEGSLRLFRATKTAGVKKIVFTSSLYAHGRMSGPAMKESDRPEPLTVYGISKLMGEHLLKWQALSSGVDFAILRLFFVYGPRQYALGGYKSVIVRTFQRLFRGEAPIVIGDGAQALDYVHVIDVIDAMIMALRPAASRQLLNIGTGHAVRVGELITLMSRVAGSTVPVIHEPPDWTAGSYRVSDQTYTIATLGWKARTELPEGLRTVYDWMKESDSNLWADAARAPE